MKSHTAIDERAGSPCRAKYQTPPRARRTSTNQEGAPPNRGIHSESAVGKNETSKRKSSVQNGCGECTEEGEFGLQRREAMRMGEKVRSRFIHKRPVHRTRPC
ncbi:hypothetical protein CEXT_10601 [Caerostris extrusa]|uniref:Uncharacterized protein n=1 Tax=Caerostris extrusa TaxID=172846 RepID=A0AAV4P5A0_CAEEX|nr:hypothetical protein CEXT_10601 [Caerostris extrusa]